LADRGKGGEFGKVEGEHVAIHTYPVSMCFDAASKKTKIQYTLSMISLRREHGFFKSWEEAMA